MMLNSWLLTRTAWIEWKRTKKSRKEKNDAVNVTGLKYSKHRDLSIMSRELRRQVFELIWGYQRFDWIERRVKIKGVPRIIKNKKKTKILLKMLGQSETVRVPKKKSGKTHLREGI